MRAHLSSQTHTLVQDNKIFAVYGYGASLHWDINRQYSQKTLQKRRLPIKSLDVDNRIHEACRRGEVFIDKRPILHLHHREAKSTCWVVLGRDRISQSQRYLQLPLRLDLWGDLGVSRKCDPKAARVGVVTGLGRGIFGLWIRLRKNATELSGKDKKRDQTEGEDPYQIQDQRRLFLGHKKIHLKEHSDCPGIRFPKLQITAKHLSIDEFRRSAEILPGGSFEERVYWRQGEEWANNSALRGWEVNGGNRAHSKDQEEGHYFLWEPNQCDPMERGIHPLDDTRTQQNLNSYL